MRVLVVEDDPALASLEEQALQDQGFEVRVCASGRSALRILRIWKPDIVLLDHGLPDAHGRDLIREIRTDSRVPVIVVTASAFERDRIASLEAGADDYVTKPFSVPELLARVRAVMRRASTPADSAQRVLAFKDVVLDRDLRIVWRGDGNIDLTRTEFEILRVILEGKGAVVTREELARAVWNQPASAVAKPLDVHMSILRKKLGDDARTPRYIVTVRGVGFRLSESELVARFTKS